MKKLDRLLSGVKKQRHNRRINRLLFLLVFLVSTASTLLAGSVYAATVVEQFSANQAIDKGSIVSLKKDNPKEVVLASTLNNDYLVGVVTDTTNNVVTYSKKNSTVSVALSGDVQVFVTNSNGDIAKGDLITTSTLEGVGMKSASSDQQNVLGVALENFDSAKAKDYGDIKTQNGSKSVKIGSINLRLFEKATPKATVNKKSGLESFVVNLVGHNISFTRILVSLIVFLAGVILSGSFVVASVRSSFISLGRNPLNSPSIYKSMRQITVISVIVILIGTAFAYVVLVV